MVRHGPLGEFEQLLLLAVLQLGERAHAPEISRYLEDSIGRDTSRGALYSSLSRLEQKGFLVWEVERAPDGSRMRRFRVTEPGLGALRDTRESLLTLWQGLDAELEG